MSLSLLVTPTMTGFVVGVWGISRFLSWKLWPSAGPRGTKLQMNSAQTRDLLWRGLLLEYITLAWNVVGTVVVVMAAIEARSVALAGFALDY